MSAPKPKPVRKVCKHPLRIFNRCKNCPLRATCKGKGKR